MPGDECDLLSECNGCEQRASKLTAYFLEEAPVCIRNGIGIAASE
jgi:hypothetical protein